MKFTKEYDKLKCKAFTTIRKNTGFYKVGQVINISTPEQKFRAKIIQIDKLQKKYIPESLAYLDADCSRKELIDMLEKWYGKTFDDFILITLEKP